MTLDVKNIDGSDNGSSNDGILHVKTGKAGTITQKQNPDIAISYTTANYDTSDTATLKDRLDDPRYYSGDTPS